MATKFGQFHNQFGVMSQLSLSLMLKPLVFFHSGAQFYDCAQCSVNIYGDDAQVRVEHEQVARFSVSTSLTVEKTQSIRLSLSIVDFISDFLHDQSYLSKVNFNATLQVLINNQL